MLLQRIAITLLLAALTSADYTSTSPGAPEETYQSCGGLTPEANDCEEGSSCVSDPRTPSCGLACDEPGICISDDVHKCSGFAGLMCPGGLECFDDPGDSCDPEDGGFDCMGVCLVALE